MPSWDSQPGGDDGDRVPAVDLYKNCVDEYRFQVLHNWSRTQYLLAFNAAILAAAVCRYLVLSRRRIWPS
jgi:hypothetical protein